MTILIADSNAVRRHGLRRLLEDGPETRSLEVDGSAPAIGRAVADQHPGVVVIVPAPDGADVAELVGSIGREATRAVVVSARRDFEHVRSALRAGAFGFVLLEDAIGELAVAVRAALDGRRYLSPALGAALLVEAEPDPGHDPLSDRELEILRLLALGHTNAEVAHRLYLSVRTIENHRASLLLKLDAAGRVELVRAALERGLLSGAASPGAPGIESRP